MATLDARSCRAGRPGLHTGLRVAGRHCSRARQAHLRRRRLPGLRHPTPLPPTRSPPRPGRVPGRHRCPPQGALHWAQLAWPCRGRLSAGGRRPRGAARWAAVVRRGRTCARHPELLGEPIAPCYPMPLRPQQVRCTLGGGRAARPPDPAVPAQALMPGCQVRPRACRRRDADPAEAMAPATRSQGAQAGGGSRGSLPGASGAKAPATESQGAQAIGGSRGSPPWCAGEAPATESQGAQAGGGSRGSLPRACEAKAPATESQGAQAIGSSRGLSPLK